MAPEWLAIDDSRASPEISRKRPQIQSLIPLHGVAGDNADAMAAHVFRDALLRRMTDIQAAEIHSNCQGNAWFQPARDGLHRTLRYLGENWLDGCRGGTTKPLYACQQKIKQVFQDDNRQQLPGIRGCVGIGKPDTR